MKLVDDVAGVVASRHSGGPAVTASMDEMDFLWPVGVGDLLHAEGQVNWTGRSSMEVGVRVLAEPWNEAGVVPVSVATSYLVFVAVDDDGRPRPVPPVLPESDEDHRRFAEAEIRRTIGWPVARPSSDRGTSVRPWAAPAYRPWRSCGPWRALTRGGTGPYRDRAAGLTPHGEVPWSRTATTTRSPSPTSTCRARSPTREAARLLAHPVPSRCPPVAPGPVR